jgi:hypothetical protein
MAGSPQVICHEMFLVAIASSTSQLRVGSQCHVCVDIEFAATGSALLHDSSANPSYVAALVQVHKQLGIRRNKSRA